MINTVALERKIPKCEVSYKMLICEFPVILRWLVAGAGTERAAKGYLMEVVLHCRPRRTTNALLEPYA